VGEDWTIIVKYTIPLVLGIIFSTNIGIKVKELLSGRTVTNILYNVGLIVLFVICIIVTISQGYTAPLYAGF
jgi:hypothetical protein